MKPYLNRPPYQSKARAFGENGMVAAAQPLTTLAAVQVLEEGGNAVDAAITAATVNNVVLPASCGLGGDAFILAYIHDENRVVAINGSGIGPHFSIDEVRRQGYSKMPLDGVLSVALPGAVDAYDQLWRKYGSMPLKRLLAPAIRLAKDGFLVTEKTSHWMTLSTSKVLKDKDSAAIFLDSSGIAPRPGGKLVQAGLAKTLEDLSHNGFRDFYEGEIAGSLVAALSEKGVTFTEKDFANHKSRYDHPLSTDYRGFRIYTNPPPSQGLILLESLKIIEQEKIGLWGHNSASVIHLMVEAKKQAFADRLKYAGDPNFVNTPLDRLLAAENIQQHHASIDPNRAMRKSEFDRLLVESDSDTTSFAVVDKWGNAVSLIHSLSDMMGAGMVAGKTGVLMNNRAGRGFTLEPAHPNCLEPGKITMSTLLPYLITKDQKPYLIGNTVGGDKQPQWNLQVIANIIDFGLNVEQAVSAPRWYSFPGTDPATFENEFVLYLETGIAPHVCSQLQRFGHDVEIVGPLEGGGGQQLIQIEDGILIGGSDPRDDGFALGF